MALVILVGLIVTVKAALDVPARLAVQVEAAINWLLVTSLRVQLDAVLVLPLPFEAALVVPVGQLVYHFC